MKARFNKLIATLIAISALTTSMVGFSSNAAEVTTPETAPITLDYVQYQTYNFTLDTSNGISTDDSMVITKTANETDFKIVYAPCTLGQAAVNVQVNGSSIGTYIIPSGSAVNVSKNFNCNKGDSIKLTITPASGYVKANGSITLYW